MEAHLNGVRALGQDGGIFRLDDRRRKFLQDIGVTKVRYIAAIEVQAGQEVGWSSADAKGIRGGWQIVAGDDWIVVHAGAGIVHKGRTEGLGVAHDAVVQRIIIERVVEQRLAIGAGVDHILLGVAAEQMIFFGSGVIDSDIALIAVGVGM